jgi:hypothetical protein
VNSSDVPVLDTTPVRGPGSSGIRRLRLPRLLPAGVPLAALVSAWILAVCAGLAFLTGHANRPGTVGIMSPTWPATSGLERAPGRPTLVVALHPACPCSRATVGELDRLMAYGRDRVMVHALVLKPSAVAEDWEKMDVWRGVAAIPGVRVHRDVDGVESERFGAVTSGQVVLYDANGRLAFSGGITTARGHAGDSDGARAIRDLLDGKRVAAFSPQAPVFGCALRDGALREGEPK